MHNKSTKFLRLIACLLLITSSTFNLGLKAQNSTKSPTYIRFTDENDKILIAETIVLADSQGLPIPYKLERQAYITQEKIYAIRASFGNGLIFRTTVNGGICCKRFDFIAYSSNELMGTVVIGINKEKTKLAYATVSTSVLKPYLLKNKVTNNYTDILDQMPGVTLTDNQLNIRNGAGWSYGAGSRTLVAVDEIPMLTGDAGNAMWSFMPQEITAGAELIKSAGSVLFGSSALNGILNIRTIEAGPIDKFEISSNFGLFSKPSEASQSYTKDPQTQTGLMGFYATRQKQNDFVFHWNFFNDQGYRMFEIDRRARFGFKYKRHSKKIKGLSFGSNQSVQYGRSGSFLLWESGNLPYTGLDSGYNYSNGTRFHIDPYLSYVGLKGSHKLITRYYYVDNKIEDDNPNTNNSNGSQLIYSEYKYKRYLNDYFILNTGLVAMGSETSSPLYKTPQSTRNLASYAQLDFHKNRWTIGAGARYEYFKMANNEITKPVFRFGANYKAAKATFLRGSIGQGFRFPSIAEAFTETSVGPVAIYSNPSLMPETSVSTEIGIKQGFQTKKLNAFVDLALFQNTLENMMEYTFGQWVEFPVAPESGFGFKGLNVGKGQIRGVELELMAQYKSKKYSWVILTGYTYSDAKNLEPDKVIAIDQSPAKTPLTFTNTSSDSTLFLKYRYKHLFKFDWQYNRNSGWMAGVSARYLSKMLNIDAAFQNFPIGFIVPGVKESRDQMGNALIFDLRAGIKVGNRFWLNGQIRNILNIQYYGRPADVQAPRLFQIQLKYSI